MQNEQFRSGVIRPVECVKEGFERIKSDYWLLFAVSLVGALIGGATMYILMGAMLCGIFYVFLKKIDGYPISFDDLWKGMNFFGPGLVITLILIVPLFVYYIFAYISFMGAVIVGMQMGGAGVIMALIGVLLIDLAVLVALVCFHTLLMFAFPLVVDRNLGAMDAMKLSARAVWQNLGGMVGLIGVNFILTLAGLIVCIGTYFVIPIIIAGNVVAYRRVFSSLNPQTGHNPGNFYQGN